MSISKRLLIGMLVGLSISGIALPLGPLMPEAAYGQNRVQRLWRRFVSRPSRDRRPATVGRGGANRDKCPFTEQELVALVPTAETSHISYLEKTTKAHPTWYFYVPYRPRLGVQTEFVLIDEAENILYQETLPLENTPGIVKVSPSAQASEFAIDQSYRWVFSVMCAPSNRSGDATVNGWVERVSAEAVLANVQALDETERYWAYADELIWFDLVDELVRSREQNPDNRELQAAWQDLLETLGLDAPTETVQPIR